MIDFQPPEGYEPDDLFLNPGRGRRRRKPAQVDFVDLPRSRRREMAVAMGWKIRSNPDGGGRFLSRDYIPGDRQWPLDAANALACQWADIHFVGRHYRRRGIFYNTTITTLAHHLAGKIECEAEDMVDARMGKREMLDVYTKKEKNGTMMVFGPRRPVEAFGGMTRDGKLAELIEDLACGLEKRDDLHGYARFEEGYRFGIGLSLVVPSPGLTVDGIVYWVDRWVEEGEIELEWPCQDERALVAQVRAALAHRLWAARSRQASDLGREAPPKPDNPVGETMAAAQSNAIKT